MTDTKDADNTGRRPLTVGRKTDKGTVKQSFSHGRSKSVVVETKKKRVVVTPGAQPKIVRPEPEKPAAHNPLAAAEKAAGKRGLSEAELKARQAALQQRRADDERRRIEQEAIEEGNRRREEARKLAAEEEKRRSEQAVAREADDGDDEEGGRRGGRGGAERSAPVRPRPEGPVRVRPDGPAARTGAPGERARFGGGVERGAPRPRPLTPLEPEEFNPLGDLGGRVKRAKVAGEEPSGEARPAHRPKAEAKRRQGKLTISAALGDDEERQRSYAAVKRARDRERDRRLRMAGGGASEKIVREVVLPESITVSDLANRMSERLADVLKFLMQQGELLRGTDTLDADTAQLIVEEFGHTVKRVAESDVEIGLEGDEDDETNLQPRPPVVTVMGHVDHGKTSLLDALRQTDVVSGESGGITQHIGAYQVQLKSGEKITFLDTPGHAAFSSMRMRGANATDIVVLVVAADDGVMPQTIEAIQHAKAADAPIIVAVNKIDKHEADPDKVLTQLLQYDVQVEAMGGDVPVVKVSALKKTGLDDLTATISALAEVLELKANPDRAADGVVIESKLDKGRGPVATVLVQRGTLKRGDIVVAGGQWGRVKALTNERAEMLAEASPATPVEVLGLDGAPDPGDQFVVVENEQRAREITEYRNRTKKNRAAPGARASLEQMVARLKEGGGAAVASEAAFVIKGDVQGSVEAITQALEGLSTDEVRARIVLGSAGGISESDVQLASASQAPIIAFNVRASKQARDLAEREGVEIRYYSVIYDLINDVKDTLSGMLAPERRETFLGYATILQVFNISKAGKVAGCRVTEGLVRRGSGVRLLRDDVVIHEGTLSTLKRFKDEVPEVKQGMECGMAFQNYQDIREGDQIECFQVELIKRSLD
ncbi:MAG: translation initiation factor IF-2 [Alphaproteobacteria bacterium]|nr:translation initiation factor IF-2 [Alphaproteobacteria bacterium]